jgi:hypothetical protein
MDSTDKALLAAYLLVAFIGIWQSSLLVIDGAVYLAAAWLGDAWALYFDQNAGRAVSTLLQYGPVWALRTAFGMSASSFLVAAHVFYFAVPLGLWVAIRTVESQRIFSRLYICAALSLIYFPSEMVQGIGFWMIWVAWIADPRRSRASKIIATTALAPLIAFTHPGVALLSIVFAAMGIALHAFGRSFPVRMAFAAAAMGSALVASYFATTALLPPTNPTIVAQYGGAKYDYIDPVWMLATLGLFPMLAALWLLLLAPGLNVARLRWRLSPLAIWAIAAIGLWFAFNGTNPLTWIFARHTAPYALAVALALALASPAADWCEASHLPITSFAAVIVAGSMSYGTDLFLFGRFVEARLTPLLSATTTRSLQIESIASSTLAHQPSNARVYFKWAAAPDYVRDIVVPMYGAQRMSFAFDSFFRSDRRAVLYRPLARQGEWVPFECGRIEHVRVRKHDTADEKFLSFLAEQYCVR